MCEPKDIINERYMIRALKRAKMTQGRLADLMGRSKDVINDWKRGRSCIPLKSAEAMGEHLDVDYRRLISNQLAIVESSLTDIFYDSVMDYDKDQSIENREALMATTRLILPYSIPTLAQKLQMAIVTGRMKGHSASQEELVKEIDQKWIELEAPPEENNGEDEVQEERIIIDA